MKNKMVQSSSIAAIVLCAAAPPQANAANLCKPAEDIVFAFTTTAKKILSVCRGPKERYLVYRFGTPSRIELQFPKQLDASSWEKFVFEGRQRLYTHERAGEYEYITGVTIRARGKRTHIRGLVKTQEGSLSILEDTTDKLPNAINQ